eukprot:TRINITY_DN11492_c6_g6_i12.p2 TRINITY_DN11492_c6_g6~~TRINITY_DN11492_c6_g6_i12.p2  ORF type:complete len:252 (+),score=48.80 TRINITY_DN11492_c6_g6_i12:1695-2450(+)
MAELPSDTAIMAQMEDIQKQIAATQPLIGPEESLDVLRSEYNDDIFVTKIDNLISGTKGLRRARGDGNCFYRSLIFGVLEWLLADTSCIPAFSEVLQSTYELALASGANEFTTEDFYETVKDEVSELAGKTLEDVVTLLNDDGMSNYFVAYLRIITAAYMKVHSHDFEPFIEGGLTVQEYCSARVEPFAVESEHLEARALTAALKIGCTVTYLDRSPGNTALVHTIGEDEHPVVCHLLFRPGHYDVLYPKT